MNEKEQVVEAGRRLVSEGYTTHTWGNVSLRGSDGRIYITPSSMDYNIICPGDIAVLNADGEIVEGERKPSIEKALHTEIYKRRPEIKAIVHTHPSVSLIFACKQREIPLITDAAAMTLRDTVKVAKYALPGTKKLAQNCADALGNKAMAVLLANHGAVCAGADFEEAFKCASVLEQTAKLALGILSAGGVIKPLPEQVLKELHKL